VRQHYFGIDGGQFVDKGHSIPLDPDGKENGTWRSLGVYVLGMVAGAAAGTAMGWKGVELVAEKTLSQMLEAPLQSPTHNLAGLLLIVVIMGEVAGMSSGGAAVKGLEQYVKNRG